MRSAVSIWMFDDSRLYFQLALALSKPLDCPKLQAGHTQNITFNRWNRIDYLQYNLLLFPQFTYLELLVTTIIIFIFKN
jgi:hypothetical protein